MTTSTAPGANLRVLAGGVGGTSTVADAALCEPTMFAPSAPFADVASSPAPMRGTP